jgi:hypothetical protein
LNSSLCRRLVRPLPALLSARSIAMVSTFFMVDTIALVHYSFKVGSPYAYAKLDVQHFCVPCACITSFPFAIEGEATPFGMPRAFVTVVFTLVSTLCKTIRRAGFTLIFFSRLQWSNRPARAATS